MRIFENIETKTKNLDTTRNTTMKTVISTIYTLSSSKFHSNEN